MGLSSGVAVPGKKQLSLDRRNWPQRLEAPGGPRGNLPPLAVVGESTRARSVVPLRNPSLPDRPWAKRCSVLRALGGSSDPASERFRDTIREIGQSPVRSVPGGIGGRRTCEGKAGTERREHGAGDRVRGHEPRFHCTPRTPDRDGDCALVCGADRRLCDSPPGKAIWRSRGHRARLPRARFEAPGSGLRDHPGRDRVGGRRAPQRGRGTRTPATPPWSPSSFLDPGHRA